LDGGSIDGLRAEVDLPGMANATTAKVAMRLNGEALDLNLAVDTPEQAMNGEAFGLDLSLASAPATASVKGTVQQQPVPGLDGALSADIPSLGGLLAWIGQPLPEGQPDPGPIKLAGSLATDGGKVTLKSLDIEGNRCRPEGLEHRTDQFLAPASGPRQGQRDHRTGDLPQGKCHGKRRRGGP
jgi:hypothetical protein